MKSVEDVKEVVPRWTLDLRILIREIGHELGVLGEHREDGLHGKLFVLRHVDFVDVVAMEKVLFASQDLLQEVLRDDGLVR